MKLSKKGGTKFDNFCHAIMGAENDGFDYLARNTGISCGKCGNELKTSYCEERLYMVECDHCGVKCLVEAGNPEQACYKTMAYPVESVDVFGVETCVFWNSVPIREPPCYIGSTIDTDFPEDIVCGMELPCCGTDGRELG